MFQLTRRGLMVGCSAAIAALAGARLGYVAFGSPEGEPNQDILVVVFLRGGIDGLSAVMPIAGVDRGYYETSRENIAVPVSGPNAALPLTDQLGLHPSGAPLYGLYQDKKMAVIHAAGLTSDTRSHFDAMKYMELGTPGSKSATTGWLTRHLHTSPNLPSQIIMPALAAGSLQPTSLIGSMEAIGMTSPNSFSFNGHWNYGDPQRAALRKAYGGDSTWLHAAGLQTLDAVDVVEYGNPGSYTPENGAVYPNNGFGQNLRTIAQMIKLQLGMRVATIDLGGWDTHEYQGDTGTGYFSTQFGNLASGLAALMTDLSNVNGTDHTQRLTMVVMSEFGRTFKQNASRGTDHGHGNVMFVVGGKVNGGTVYGAWPGLHTDQLYDRRDLAITTDYRSVLSEILIRRLQNANLGYIFPGYTSYQPAGILQGADLTPNYNTPTVTPTPGSTIPANTASQIYLPMVRQP
ncbi:MAG: DUF1501 domain-containing protein [Caldilineaceae bacterium]|nr:DUF1501 domain-containing protein [Caldilineaceae bacterium]